MKNLLLIPLLSMLASCAVPQGRGEVAFVYDNEKSFRDFALLAGTAIAAGYSAAATASAEVTKQVASKEGTKQLINNNSTKVALGAQDVTVKTFVPPTP